MASIGNLYVIYSPVEATIEWLVVRFHPDDMSLALLVPCDDFPFDGGNDVPLMLECPLSARCGQSIWLRQQESWIKVRKVSDATLINVRARLASLARGDVVSNSYDCDPEYAAWMSQLESAREYLAKRRAVYVYRKAGMSPHPFIEIENGLPVHPGDLEAKVSDWLTKGTPFATQSVIVLEIIGWLIRTKSVPLPFYVVHVDPLGQEREMGFDAEGTLYLFPGEDKDNIFDAVFHYRYRNY